MTAYAKSLAETSETRLLPWLQCKLYSIVDDHEKRNYVYLTQHNERAKKKICAVHRLVGQQHLSVINFAQAIKLLRSKMLIIFLIIFSLSFFFHTQSSFAYRFLLLKGRPNRLRINYRVFHIN